MRAHIGAIAGFGIISLVSAASAQQPASSFFTGIPSTQISNVPVDTSRSVVPQQGRSALFSRFDFSALFSKSIIPTYPPKTGISPLPPPSAFPSTTYEPFKMVGQPPFLIKWMFGTSNNNPMEPMKPFTPSTQAPVGPGSN